jgi:hypothetical protein
MSKTSGGIAEVLIAEPSWTENWKNCGGTHLSSSVSFYKLCIGVIPFVSECEIIGFHYMRNSGVGERVNHFARQAFDRASAINQNRVHADSIFYPRRNLVVPCLFGRFMAPVTQEQRLGSLFSRP